MPTPKQVRFHYRKCMYYFWKLQKALNDAHNANVIEYFPRDLPKGEPGKPSTGLPSVCESVHDAKRNFEAATKEARADALKAEIMSELKGVY